ncbi:lipoate--protein ligase [Intestinimonas sp.]|uniref:lipoate--protein ligase n=1 Tax=Intestinimonas sp. TaxID=1965293 RepID=UPI00260D12E8|nr:lipoate--protein ligase [Intestinimonas sp.]
MYLLENNCTDPAWNLALDEYLLTRFPREVLALWRNGPSVIIGKNQNALEEIDLDFVRSRQIPVVRRLTGGGAVFHDLGNLNYTLVQPCGTGDFNNYAKFTKPIVDFLATLGVEAALSGRNDLLVDGQKFSGNAQAVRGGRILHHGTLLFSADLSRLAGALRPQAIKLESKGVKSVSSRVTNLAGHLPAPMEVEEFLERLRAYFLQTVSGLTPCTLTAADRAAVDDLCREKYRSWDWNFGAAPRYTWSRAIKFPFGLVDARLDVDHGIIRSAALYGDYFGRLDSAGLARRLVGLPHRREALLPVLQTIPLWDYIAGCGPEDLLALLCP